MKLICIGSNSSGNGYILQGNNQTLLLEAGVPISDVRKRTSNFANIVGCLVTHRHGDHSRYAKDYLKAGVNIYSNEDVVEKVLHNAYGSHCIRAMEYTTLGEFIILAVPANHDVPCFSYFIHHLEMGNLAFITDSNDLGYAITELQHIMIECNWSDDCINQAVAEGRTPWFVAKRSRETHMSLHNAIEYIQSELVIERLKEIIMIHISNENADPNMFQKEMENATGKAVYAAYSGMEIDLTNE